MGFCGKCCGIIAVVVLGLALLLPLLNRDVPGNPSDRLGSGAMFDSIAPYYDMGNRLMSLGLDQSWRRALVAGLQLKEGDKVLDLGSGTGDVAMAIGHGGHPSIQVKGVDPSPNMLSFATEKAAQAAMSDRVKFEVGDAQKLEGIADGSIDKVSMAFAIRNVPDRLKALKEIRRVTKGRPGSRICLLEFSLPPENTVLGWISGNFVRVFVPILGSLVSSHPEEYAYLASSIREFPQPTVFAGMIEEAGMKMVDTEHYAGGAVQLYIASSDHE
mmetsp:Transcript_1641/g.3666  ORF Transcript_1641/g.3666 Transcript_1641/m.3666 type:complete len:272 (+) Transcript_1641:19-834(+)